MVVVAERDVLKVLAHRIACKSVRGVGFLATAGMARRIALGGGAPSPAFDGCIARAGVP